MTPGLHAAVYAAPSSNGQMASGILPFRKPPATFSKELIKLNLMASSRTLPLYDPNTQPSSWNERMVPGEYAVHYSSSDADGPGPVCTVFSRLSEAKDFAASHIRLRPNQRCRIYDHTGFIGAPILELCGAQFRGETDLSPRFRRYAGSFLFFAGFVLTLIDWTHGFRFYWPAIIGMPMLLPGVILLVIEFASMLNQSRRRTNPETTL